MLASLQTKLLLQVLENHLRPLRLALRGVVPWDGLVVDGRPLLSATQNGVPMQNELLEDGGTSVPAGGVWNGDDINE